MSYARFGWEGSDVYVFATPSGGEEVIECCGCNLATPIKLDPPLVDLFGIVHEYSSSSFYADYPGEMISHLNIHIAKGQTVPEYTLDRLREEDDARS